ncbi:hypothetical protein Trydic_g7877 [Trypoxylus dichotomus]
MDWYVPSALTGDMPAREADECDLVETHRLRKTRKVAKNVPLTEEEPGAEEELGTEEESEAEEEQMRCRVVTFADWLSDTNSNRLLSN